MRKNERGQNLVELALTLPLILMILAGATHFGLMMHTQQVITNASRVGARRATQPNGDAGRVREAVLDYCEEAGLDPADVSVEVVTNVAASEVRVTVTCQFTSSVEGLLRAMIDMVTGQSSESLRQLQATTVMRL